MKAMILAAGRGERMRPLTDALPKPLLPVRGRPLIEWHIAALVAAGVDDIVVNLGWLGNAIREHLGDGARFNAGIRYSEEGWPALETGGGVFRALPLLGTDPFLLLSADIHADYSLASLVAQARAMPAGDLAHLVLVPNPAHHPQGDFSLQGARILNSPRALTFANYSVLRPQLFDGCRKGTFPIAPLWRAAADAGRVSGELFTGSWCNLGTPDQLRELNTSHTEST